MGDDLKQARGFITAAMTEMDSLLSEARLDRNAAEAALTHVQKEAKNLRALGIYRAAQSVLDSYNASHSQPKIDGRLMALYKLIAQYGEGLEEITPLHGSIDAPIDIVTQTETPEDLKDRFETAREVLIPLIPLAGETAPALERLANLSIKSTAKPPNIRHAESQITFESLMPDVTNAALRTARAQGKSVSVSYAADNLSLKNSQVEMIRSELEGIVANLVRDQIDVPLSRAAKGLSRVGHIDISVSEGSEGLDISVNCGDKTVTVLPVAKAHSTTPIHSKPHISEDILTDDIIDLSLEIGA